MRIQSASAYVNYPYLNVFSPRKQFPTDGKANISTLGANISDTVSISQAAQNYHADQSNALASGNSATAVFHTDQGPKKLNIDAYFSAGRCANGASSLFQTLPPLLLPTQNNIKAVTENISAAFPQFLAENNIPSAPSNITYDQEGQIQLPADYPYAEEFKLAVANNSTMARELQTVHALSSHFAGMEKSYPFLQEYAAAATQAEARAVVDKYSYLFGDNRRYSTIALHFSENGALSITADGEPLS